MRLCDLFRDVEAEAQPSTLRMVPPLPERLEQLGKQLRRDGPFVLHADDHSVRIAPVERDADRSLLRRMLQGVAEEVREDLRQAIFIPVPARVPEDLRADPRDALAVA